MNEKLKLKTENQKYFDVCIISLLVLLSHFIPYVSYTYNRTEYTLSGINLLFGKSIMSNQFNIEPNMLIWVGFITVLAAIIISLLFTQISPRKRGGLISISGIILVILQVFLKIKIYDILGNPKNAGIEYGSIITIVLGFILLIRGMHILYVNKVITPLDFLVLPGLIYIVINNYLPMIGIFIAFKKINFSVGIFESDWVGLENFKYLFATKDAWIITRNTLGYNIIFIVLGNVVGILAGIFLYEVFSKKLQKVYQTSILLPQLISFPIIAYIGYAFLSSKSGFINNSIFGDENAVRFYMSKQYWPYILVFVGIWKQLGYNSIIFLSSIVGINRNLYEAAYVDGASKWRQITSITIPLLKPTIIILTLLRVGRIFYSDFGLFYQVPMDSGPLYPVTQTIDTYVYRGLMQLNNISMAAAASVYQSIVGFILVLSVNLLVRKIDKENALF